MSSRVSVPAPMLVLGAVASVQSGAAVATRLFPDAGPMGTVLLRLGLSALLLLALGRPQLRGRPMSDLRWGLGYGAAMATMNATFYLALDRIPLGAAVTIEFIGPLGVAVAGSSRRRDFVWVLLAGAGVALLTTGGAHIDALGVVFALIAGAAWAAYIVLVQRAGRIYAGTTGLTLALCVAAVAVAPFGVVQAGHRLWHPSVLGRGAAVAVLSSVVPYSLELFALRRMRASVFGVLLSLEPAMAAVSGLFFLGQHLRAREWVAIGLVVAASVGSTRSAPPQDVPAEPGSSPIEALAQ